MRNSELTVDQELIMQNEKCLSFFKYIAPFGVINFEFILTAEIRIGQEKRGFAFRNYATCDQSWS